MVEPINKPPSDEPNALPTRAEAQRLLEEIKLFKEQAEAHLKHVEIARKNTDSEALLAFNAKKACEEHASAVASIKGTTEADANTIATNKQRSDEALAAVNTAKATVDGDMKAIDSRRKEIDQSAIKADQSAASIIKSSEAGAARLREVEASKESVETALRAVNDSAKAASQAASNTDSAQKQAEKSSTDAAAVANEISEQHKMANQNAQDTKALLTQAQAAEANLTKVLEHLAKSDEISTGHEQRVEAIKAELQTLIARVEGLLPGATSAGLASSFNKQRARFTSPQKNWFWMFVICIGGLVVVAVPSFLSAIGWSGHPTDQTWNAAWRNFILRLPIVAPIVWLAIYAGRNYMMSLRMEEDYAYKEAISTAFEGYKREMEKITASDGENPTPITILCTNILTAIAERPGRIYEGKQQDINLLTELRGFAERTADLSKKQLATR